ncbi:hypothetical protein P168DRAFT_168191 [Aspergillus campestris IBT 28561]|uniref:Uncharacterized protein n=1 Tax=Aspergillus campestris (strain IBT 28561) TaxID=1392248 RepID=A0A2I1D1J0_ASPC2|nr:uncharacterized protein P168DRAFT_168191 [Aspergillus campestris IBT 28561]PKY03742.1 hypothetical protein P168DRAFT_168191 [Aspergillus campestris IBT 28561]
MGEIGGPWAVPWVTTVQPRLSLSIIGKCILNPGPESGPEGKFLFDRDKSVCPPHLELSRALAFPYHHRSPLQSYYLLCSPSFYLIHCLFTASYQGIKYPNQNDVNRTAMNPKFHFLNASTPGEAGARDIASPSRGNGFPLIRSNYSQLIQPGPPRIVPRSSCPLLSAWSSYQHGPPPATV